jgi:hypothetical protein
MLRSMKRLVARGTVLLALWCSQGTVAWGAVEELPTAAVAVEATPAESSAKMNGVELGFRALLAEMAGEGKPVPPDETDAVLKRLMAAKRVFEAKASVATRPAASNSGAVAP